MTALEDWMKQNGVRKGEFAKRIGLSPSYLSRICAGTYFPSREVWLRIRAATNGAVTPNDFLPPMAQDPDVDPLTGETFE